MNDNAKKWVEALRSGEFQQTTGKLVARSPDGVESHCCLGVACEVYRREFGGDALPKVPKSERRDDIGYKDSTNKRAPDYVVTLSLPDPVREWLGLADQSGRFFADREMFLTNLNDRGDSFAKIADVIESEPEGLFA